MPSLLCWLQGAVALLLGIQSVVVATIIIWLDGSSVEAGRFRLVRVVDQTHLLAAGLVDTRWIILVCLALSACVQALALVLFDGRLLRPMRWLEASVCMPTATMAVAVEAGVRDVYAIEALFGLAWAAQVLSACAWRHSDTLPQCAAWIVLLMAYGPILNALVTNRERDERGVVLVVGEFVLALLCLGVYTYERLQPSSLFAAPKARAEAPHEFVLFSIQDEDDEPDGTRLVVFETQPKRPPLGESALVLLSFFAHTLLCWSVLGPVLAVG